MHFCKVTIAIGGDVRNTIVRDEFNPISWPEIDIIRLLHGDEAIVEAIPFVRVNQLGKDERARLTMIYGEAPCQECWGGRNAPRELEAPEATLTGVAWFNPLTGHIEGELRMPPPRPVHGKVETFGDMTKPAPRPVDDDEFEPFDETGPVEAAPPEPAGDKPVRAIAEAIAQPVKKVPVRRRGRPPRKPKG